MLFYEWKDFVVYPLVPDRVRSIAERLDIAAALQIEDPDFNEPPDGLRSERAYQSSEGGLHGEKSRWKIKKVSIGKRDADRVSVHVQYIHTPATALPSKPSIMEMELGYQKAGNDWALVQETGSRYIGPQH